MTCSKCLEEILVEGGTFYDWPDPEGLVRKHDLCKPCGMGFVMLIQENRMTATLNREMSRIR